MRFRPFAIGRVAGSLMDLLVATVPFLLLFPLANAAPQAQQAPVDKTLCYAFLRGGDIWTVCQGKRERIALQSKAWDFAISADGTTLAAVREKRGASGSTHRSAGVPETEILLVTLKGNLGSEIKPLPPQAGRNLHLFTTCGTIATPSFTPDRSAPSPHSWPRTLPGIYDILANKQLKALQFVDFRCSSDNRVIAGLSKRNFGAKAELVVLINDEQQRTIPIFLMNGNFALSPNGKYLAYSHAQGGKVHVCMAELGGPASCSSEPAVDPAPDYQVSVSDSGEVIYAGDVSEDCGGTPCSGIAYWRVGMPEPVSIERNDASSPQWITPQATAALHQWNISRSTDLSSR